MSKARDLADGIAVKLDTTDAPVVIDTSSPPTVGQVLTATDSTHASWSTVTPDFILYQQGII